MNLEHLTDTLDPDDIVLTARDITELGLEEAPKDAGPSLKEMASARGRRLNHG